MNRIVHSLVAVVALILLLSTGLYGQTCKPYRDAIDPITKERRITFSTKPIVGAWFNSVNGRLHLEFAQFYTSIRSMADGAPVIFLFTDDTTLELKNVGIEVASYTSGSTWMLSTYLPLTEDQLKLLATKTVKMVRLQLTDYSSDRNYTAKHAAELQKAAACLVTTLGL
jgi:hypothetical protein